MIFFSQDVDRWRCRSRVGQPGTCSKAVSEKNHLVVNQLDQLGSKNYSLHRKHNRQHSGQVLPPTN